MMTATLSGSAMRSGWIQFVANCRSIITVMSTSDTTVCPARTSSRSAERGVGTLRRNRFDLVDVLRCFDEDHVAARLRVEVRPVDRGGESERATCVGARDDHQVLVDPGVEGGFQLAEVFTGADEFLVG